jgi:hypothetical protein
VNTTDIIRVLAYDHDNQQLEVAVRDGNVIRLVWVPLKDVYINEVTPCQT